MHWKLTWPKLCTGMPTDGCVAIVQSRGFQAPQQLHTHDITAKSSDLFIYEGPLSKAVKNLKVCSLGEAECFTYISDRGSKRAVLLAQRLSIASCALSVLGSPVLIWGVADSMPLAAQISIAATIGGFGVFTTSGCLIHPFSACHNQHIHPFLNPDH